MLVFFNNKIKDQTILSANNLLKYNNNHKNKAIALLIKNYLKNQPKP